MMLPAVSTVDAVALSSLPALDDVANGVLDVIVRLLHTRLAVISRIESTTCTVTSVVDQHHALAPGQFFDLHETFCKHMLESGHVLCIEDTNRVSAAFRSVPLALELGIQSYLGVPLIIGDGRVFGSLWTADNAPRHFSPDDRALLHLMARLLIHELDRDAHVRHNERIEQVQLAQSGTDQLTGLLMRDGFNKILAREVARHGRYHVPYAVAVLKIVQPHADNVNAGSHDILRQELASILMRGSRMVDCCARIAPDEFAVLFAETTAAGVAVWQDRIHAAIDAWNLVHTASGLSLTVAVGIADCNDVIKKGAASALAIAEQRA